MTDDAHERLAARTLRIPLESWRRVVESTRRAEADRLSALRRAFAREHPPPAPTDADPAPCPACGCPCPPFIGAYGRCVECGHGVLLAATADASLYRRADYYEHKDSTGAGYDDYEAEREYREQKGLRLVEQLIRAHGGAPSVFLEVGSGYGFTRAAAAALGLNHAGVDVSPHAAFAAMRLYGYDTFTGTLADAQPPPCDLVLYQFVLEHLPDPAAELRQVARVLAPGGLACFVVPSMEATEIAIFGAAYRSFRADHLHLFTRRSITRLLEAAGLSGVSVTSTCNLHLLSPALSPEELQQLYEAGAGPDLVVLARRSPP